MRHLVLTEPGRRPHRVGGFPSGSIPNRRRCPLPTILTASGAAIHGMPTFSGAGPGPGVRPWKLQHYPEALDWVSKIVGDLGRRP